MNKDSNLAVVTGASKRVGKVIALGLAQRGWKVIIHFHTSEAEAVNTVQEIRDLGGSAEMVRADLTDPEQIQTLFHKVPRTGNFSLLVNSAAVMKKTSLQDVTADEWDATMDLNLRAPLLCSQYAYRLMEDNGLIINICDAYANQIWRKNAVYGLSKSALEHLTLMLAENFKPRVRVNAVSPGLLMKPDDMSMAEWQHLLEKLGKEPVTETALLNAIDVLIDHPDISGEVIQIPGSDLLIRSNKR